VGKNGMVENKYINYNDKLNNYFENQKNLINELLRVTKKHIFYNIQMLGNNKIDFLKLLGYFHNKIKDIIIWQKNGIPHIEAGVLNSSFEFIIIFSNDFPNKKKFYDGNFKGNFNNVIKILNTHTNPFAKKHKAIMPLDIPRMLLQKFGKENDIWYDCYMGTGTTALGCIMEKRNYIGSEINKDYCKIANERLKPYLTQKELF
jgi:DNA modification methylase